ncbi:MAG: lipopolysaccharide assembly protein LapA domain-containing protein [Devosiaceae bacterium]
MLGKFAKRLWTLLIVLPLAVLLIVFGVANRQAVQISLDPVVTDAPWFAVSVPLFVALFAALILGVLIGGIATWFTQGAYRKQARDTKVQATKLARERDVQKAQLNKLSGTRALPSPASLR